VIAYDTAVNVISLTGNLRGFFMGTPSGDAAYILGRFPKKIKRLNKNQK